MSHTAVTDRSAPELEVGPTGFLARVRTVQGFQILVLLAVVVALFGAMEPDAFLTVPNLRTIAVNTAILSVLGVGMTFVIITGGIDLSVGSVLVFSGVVASKTMTALGGEGWGVATVGIIVSCASGLAWGVLNGILVSKAKVPALIVTLGTLGMALGLAQIITDGVDIREVPDVLGDSIGFGSIGGQVPILVVIAAVVVAIGIVLLHKTKAGLFTYAIGSNAEACRRVGIKVDRQLIFVYGLSGFLAGVSGILSLSYFQSTTLSGQSTTNLNVIAGVVIGGTSLFGGVGSIFGTVLGLFIPSVLQNGFVIIGVQPFWQQVVVGTVLIAAVFIDQRRRDAALRGGPNATLLNKLLGRRSVQRKETRR
jgi:ribose transport system permease protein